MSFSLVTLTWFDVVSVSVPVATIILIHILKSLLKITNVLAPTETPRPISDRPAGDATPGDDSPAVAKVATKNGKLHKQKSVFSDDALVSAPSSSSSSPSPASSPNSSPNSSARNSLNLLNSNGPASTIPFSISPPMLFSSLTADPTDEFHEDEDTLSLDNLFPCDQSELYASKKINFIIDELIQTETSYVQKMRQGLRNYGHLMAERADLPETLKGDAKRQQLLGNIEDILHLHEREILPLMLRNRHDLKALYDEFAAQFNRNKFYCYVVFMMQKRASMQLRQENREWLLAFQTDINDKLGIDSFLVQPIQRLTRYPLLLQQFITEFYKSGLNCKPVVMSVCKLETRLRRQLDVVNESEHILNIEDTNDLNLSELGDFHKCTEFDAYHYRTRKKYRTKVFLFDRCLVCTEVRKRRLSYRHHYRWDLLELRANSFKSLTVLMTQSKHTKIPTPTPAGDSTAASTDTTDATASAAPATAAPGFKEEFDLTAAEGSTLNQWLRCARGLLNKARREAIRQNQFSLPMDLVLGVGFAIWFIWHYL